MDKNYKKIFDPQKVNLFDIKVRNNFNITHALELNKCEMSVGFATSMEHSVKGNNIKILLDILIKREDEILDFAEFNFEFYFTVSNLEDFKTKHGNEFLLSSQVAIPLVSVSISTARGIIFERLNNETDWKNLFIPIISPKQVLHQQN